MLMAGGINIVPILGSLVSIIISGPLMVGLYMFFLSFIRGEDAKTGQLYQGFNSFGNAFVAYLLMIIFILLWSILFIIPGVIACFSYSLTFFIIADEPKIDGFDALKLSKKMMNGNKMNLFFLGCRFSGWFFVGMITFGIGFIWVFPYMMASIAKFYDVVKNEYSQSSETPVARQNETVKKIVEEQVRPTE